jgi:hypothetical protein
MTNRTYLPSLRMSSFLPLLMLAVILQYPVIMVQSEIIALDVIVDASSDEVRMRTTVSLSLFVVCS